MPDMEAPIEDALEQGGDQQTALDGDGSIDDIEAPEADTAEQRTSVISRAPVVPDGLPAEANEADVAEQAYVVDLEDDDYR